MPRAGKTTLIVLAAVLAAALAASGCARLQKKFSTDDFDTRAGTLYRAIRWGEFEKAFALMAPEADRPDPSLLRQVKVTDYRPGPYEVSADATRITQPVTFRYYRSDTLVERTTQVETHWRYEPEAGQWFLESGFPTFSSPP